jgi:hypothetical protein
MISFDGDELTSSRERRLMSRVFKRRKWGYTRRDFGHHKERSRLELLECDLECKKKRANFELR